MNITFYNHDGQPIPFEEWAVLFEQFNYRLLQQTTVGAYRVSTVWVGIDQGFGLTESPLIFETMVFAETDFHSRELGLPELEGMSRRYTTAEEAQQGHNETVLQLNATAKSLDDILNEEHSSERDEG